MSIGTDAIERAIESNLHHIAPPIHVVFDNGKPVVSTEPCDLTTPDLFLLHITDAKRYLWGMREGKQITAKKWLSIIKLLNEAESELSEEIKHRVSAALDNGTLRQLEDALDWEENQ